MAGSCLSPLDIQEFLFGSLSPEHWAQARAHLADCEVCRSALAPLFLNEPVGGSSSDGAPRRPLTTPRARAANADADLAWMLGPYRVLSELGRGGQGQVYLAEDTRLARKVALKVLSASFTPTSQAFQRFQREALALSRLDHPGLCAVYEAGEIDGIAYIAMRFVEGETLASRLSEQAAAKRDPRFERDRILAATRLVERAARALHAAHEAGLLHRDVKPGNIMVTRDEEPVILDFGLAHDVAGDLQTLTRSGELMGTPAYLSPEQLSGGGIRLDRRTDIYSLGVTLYQCVTLRLPFESPTRDGLYRKILAGNPPDPRLANPEVSRDLKVILDTVLETSCERRYQTALELAEDLRRAREYEPIRARPAGPALRFRRWMQRNPALATSTIAIFVVLAVALTISLVLLNRLSFEEGEKSRALGREREQTQALGVALVDREAALNRTEALRLAALSSGIGSKNPGLALLLALEADGKQRSLLATNAALEAIGSLRERRALVGHSSLIASVRVSPDGRHVVTASDDETARVWELATGDEVALLRGHTRSLEHACFSPDGSRIATASDDATIRLWRFPGGKCLHVLRGHTKQIRQVEFSPDGERLISGSIDGTAKLWSASSGKLILDLGDHDSFLTTARFSPDGARLLTSTLLGVARISDARTGDEMLSIGNPDGQRIASALFSRDGRWVATVDASSENGRIWDSASGKMVFEVKTSADPSAPVDFSRDGRLALFSAPDHSVRVIELGSWKTVSELKGHQSSVLKAVFSPDSRRVATASADRTVRVWDAGTGAQIALLQGHVDAVTDVVFGNDGGGLVTASADGTARVWDVEPSSDILELAGSDVSSVAASFAPDGERVLTVSRNTAFVRDARDGRKLATLRGHEHSILSAEFSPDGSRVVTATNGFSARIWDARTGAQVAAIAGPKSGASSARFSPDGRHVLIVYFDDSVCLWDLKGAPVWRIALETSKASASAVFSPDGERVLIAHGTGALAVRTADGQVVTRSDGMDLNAGDVQITRDGRLALVSPWGSSVYVIDAATCALEAEIVGVRFGNLYSRFSPDSRHLVIATLAGVAHIWDTSTRRFEHMLRGHEGALFSAQYSGDGKYVVTASADCTARLWDAASGDELCTFKGHRDRIRCASFSPDSRRILTGSEDGTVRIWPLDPIEIARRRVPRTLTPNERDLYEIGSRELRRFRRNVWDLKRLAADLWLLSKQKLCR